MSNRIYIQTRNDGHFLNTEAFSAFEGFSAKGYEIFPLRSLALLPRSSSKNDLAFGNVDFVLGYLDRIGVSRPPLLDYPEELHYLLGREIKQTTLGELDFTEPVFVKPSHFHKLFTGLVLEKAEDIGWHLSGLPSTTPIYTSPIVNFISEWRAFILNGEVKDVRRYSGDWDIMPNPWLIKKAVEDFKSSPVAYSLDFGISDMGLTHLVEANSCYALGSYGLDSLTYANMIEAAWIEITN